MTKYKQQQQQKKKKKKIGGKTKTRLGREKTIADAAEKNRAVHRQWTIGGCNSSTRVDSLSITSSSPCAEHKKKIVDIGTRPTTTDDTDQTKQTNIT